MYCRKCGKEINDDAYVCIYCGAKAHETPEEKPANTGYAGYGLAKAGKIISIVFMVLSFVLGIIYGIAIAAIIGGTTY